MTDARRCTLCGSGVGITPQLIEWLQPVVVEWTRADGTTATAIERWTHADRCRDRRACRRRVETAGAPWLVRDGFDPLPTTAQEET